LTTYEAIVDKIPHKLITDNMVGYLMQTKSIDFVTFGADRVCSNGDTINKIGSY